MSSDSPPAPAPETIVVTKKRVACDGGDGALGHPLVYLDMGQDNFVECGYCDRRFILSEKADSAYHDPSPRAPGAH